MDRRCGRCGAVLTLFDRACPKCSAAQSAGARTETDTLADPPPPAGAHDKETVTAAKAAAPPAPEAIERDPLLAAIPAKDGAKLLGGVRLTRRLGVGGMGAVYAAHNPVLDMAVAVKVMHPHLALDESHAERFVREAQVSARIDHQNLVRCLHAGNEHGLTFIIMELVEGSSAAELLRDRGGALSEAEAVRIVLDATRGLAEAHRRGIVHRDVKPDNILVRREDGRAKLADLGLARALAQSPARITATGTALGTPVYMAPEQVEDAASVGPAADVYSMGATLYELLCGTPAFSASSVSALFEQILRRPPLDPSILRPGISPAVRDVILRALEKSPAVRYATGAELEAALEKALPGASADTPPPMSRDEVARAVTSAMPPGTGSPPVPSPTPAPAAAPPAALSLPTPEIKRRYKVMLAVSTVAGVIAASLAVYGLVAKLTWGGPTIVLGLLPDRQVTTERLRSLDPVLRFLQRATGRKVEPFVGGSYTENVDAFVQGRVHLAHFGGVTYVLAKAREPRALPLVQRDVDRRFRTLFVANAATGITKLEDLRGKRFAYVDPLSTAGYAVPATELLAAGIDPRAGFSMSVFMHGHDATIEAVSQGQVDAGAVDGRVYYDLLHQGRIDAARTRVVATTAEFPDDVWVASPALDEKTRAAIVKAFLELNPAREADALALGALEAKRFVAARDEDYDGLREKVKLLQAKQLLGN